MSIAHLAIGSRDVQATADFLTRTMKWKSIEAPTNVPRKVVRLDLLPERDRSQQIHMIYSRNSKRRRLNASLDDIGPCFTRGATGPHCKNGLSSMAAG